MVTDTQLQEWKRLTDAATDGPWERTPEGWVVRSGDVATDDDGNAAAPVIGSWHGADGLRMSLANGQFVVAAREAMPALMAEVERLRTPSGEAGRVGHEAFIRRRETDGAPGHTWEEMVKDAPRVSEAWMAAGHAERAVAYALAAGHVRWSAAWMTRDGRERLVDEVRALAQPPASATERMARLSALLREAAALAGEVVSDADAPAELRVAADTVHRGLVGRTADDTTDLPTLLDRVRQEYGQRAAANTGAVLQHVSLGPDGMTPAFRVPVEPVAAPETTPTMALSEDEELKRDGEAYARENGPRFAAQHADDLAALVTTYEDAKAQEHFDHLREAFWTRTWDAEKTPTAPSEPLKCQG